MTTRRSRALRWASGSAALAVAMTATPPARAGGTGMEGLEAIAYIAGAIVAIDMAFTTYDAVEAARGVLPSRGVCVAEAIATAPQLLAGALFLSQTRRAEPLGIALTAWMSALTAHGIWGATASDKEPRASGASALRGGPARAAWSVGFVSRF